MKKLFSFLVVLMLAQLAYSQGIIKGTVVDKSTGETLIGVSVYHPVTGIGMSTSLDGSFSFEIPSGKQEIIVSYVGYKTQSVEVNARNSQKIKVELENEAIGLNDVTVTSSVAIRRKTPVALSVVDPVEIQEKLGTKEFPEILKSTPGVYATKQGGGFGDSRINLRGFESANIAVMINGVPMNDMEWGGVYWSNWAGLSDVTRSMQVQRGLGASKVAAPSVGGSINIVTKSTEAKKGGSISYAIGNDGYNKYSFNVSTGLNNGWAVTLLGSKTWGEGYIKGTEFEGYSYFLNISKIINENHQISFTGFGAPQWHNQRFNGDKLLISEWEKLKDGYKFNPTYGYDANGQRKTGNYNYYHKPQLSLNHFWTINEKSSLSTAAYMSIGNGGGYSWRGNSNSYLYGTNSATGKLNETYRTVDGYMDYGKLQKENAENPNGSQAVITSSRNNHNWVGLLSTYNTRLLDIIDFTAGLDLRYYAGLHDAYIVDLMGGKFYIDPSRANVKYSNSAGNLAYINQHLKEGDIVYRDNTGYVAQEGVFAQGEYTKDKLNVFVSGSVSNNTYWKVDRFYYDNEKSAVKSFIGYTAKTGANYNIDEKHNVFANVGYISRAPFMSGGYFASIHTSNAINENAVNEKVFSAELGYGFRSQYFSTNLNLYRTNWLDKATVRSFGSSPDDGIVNITGINALHQGVELDFTAKPFRNLEIKGMVSIGDWEWTNNAKGYVFNKDGQPVNASGSTLTKDGNIIDMYSSDHAYVEMNLKGVKVGNSAQTSFALGAKYKFLKDFSAGLDYTYFARNYANFSIAANTGITNYVTPWMIPAAGVLDFNANYKFKINGLDATLYGNIDNLLNQIYIADAQDLTPTTSAADEWKSGVSVMYGFGTTYSISLRVRF
ncbi:MAG: TonB-dependent receptor [Bacteroidia bacterium]|jgi:outer membrane cobalamin receptor|nr:TonB-dependent receptor [Bacteroidia bacterium]